MNVREMYNYGYKWTGMIPLTAEEARNLFLMILFKYIDYIRIIQNPQLNR